MSDGADDDLIILTRYASAVEAGFALSLLMEAGIDARLDGEAASTNLSYYGTATGDSRVLVRRADLREAAEVLTEKSNDAEAEAFLARGDAEGWWAQEADSPSGRSEAERPKPSPELLRAYHAAIVGLFVFPLAVQLYSLYLIVRHRLFLPDRGGNDWRFYVAMAINTLGMFCTRMWWGWEDFLPLWY